MSLTPGRKIGARTGMREQFVQEYVLDFNATRAAIRAGYSPKSADQTGHSLLKLPEIRSQIDALLAKREAKAEMSGEEIIRKLTLLARGNIGRYLEWGPQARRPGRANNPLPTPFAPQVRLHPSKDLTEEEMACIQEISQGQFGIKMKMHDPIAALNTLAKYYGLIPSGPRVSIRTPGAGVEVDGQGGVTIYLPDNGRGAPTPELRQVGQASTKEVATG